MEKFKSRKFWMAIISALLIVANEGLGWNIPAETVMSFAAVVLGYLFSQGYVDGKQVEGNHVILYDEIYDDLED
jgi:uncharacterized membrane protein